jgi:hypothetical protein
VPQLPECFGFDLTNPLSRNIKLLADFFEGMVSIHIDTETHPKNFGFSRRETGKYLPS